MHYLCLEESGKEEERGIHSLPEKTGIASHLSSLRLLTDIQVLASSMHFCAWITYLGFNGGWEGAGGGAGGGSDVWG